MRKYILVLVLFFYFIKNYSQNIVSGIIKSKTELLVGANILAKPLTKGAKFSYAVTNVNGKYTLKLTKNALYKFTISFVGCITLKEDILLNTSKLTKNFNLKEDPNELQEIIINYKEPIVVKKDTTTYRVKSFVNGKEHKLREVLKKLPGVEVDRNGNVTVKGKKVTTVLVENKEFFTGDSKLAVNNIPADVVKEIQVIEDYHESDLLKGFETSEEVALNINLKEDKKQFAFGDMEIGAGIKDRYIFHPTLFKYSKKTSYSFIGDANNTSNKSFTLKDYINYEGGLDTDNLSEIFSSSVAKLLRNKEFYDNKHYFGGLNFQYETNPKNRWTAFFIALQDKTDVAQQQNNDYIIDDIQEQRVTHENLNQSVLLGKLQLKSAPSKKLRIKLENKLEIISGLNNLENESNLINNNNLIFSKNNNVNTLSLQSGLKIERKINEYHTSQAKLHVKFSKVSENQKWLANNNIFSSQIPITPSANLNVTQNIENKKYEFKSLLKHFWIVNPVNHLFFSLKNNLFATDYNNNIQQLLIGENKIFDNFKNNSLDKQLFSSVCIKYKYLLGDVFFTTQLEYLNYIRSTSQFLEDKIYNNFFLLPQFEANWEIDNKRSLKFSYLLKNKFPRYQDFFINNSLHDFNAVRLGNINLRESNYHTFRIYFRKYQSYGWSFYPRINYKIIKSRLQNKYLSKGIYYINTPVNTTLPDKELNISTRVVYGYKYWRASLRTSYVNRNYVSFNANKEILATNNSFSVFGGFKSMYIKGPNIDVSFNHNYNTNKNLFFNSISDRTKFNLALDYDINDWQFKAETRYSYFKNKTSKTTNTFNETNASIFYQKEDSMWGFELKATNIGNNAHRISSSLSDILFYETKTRLFPRTILAKVVYKI
ncbi:carboxypeptidase-like regulatory domain-containing protein [Tenacibaculum finnmarkense]|uniref:carboxypeptidase-like regulatory domain-containing protein n=1 Tax=Tenacibaculum finnmarkense TaxID=2781243 RepID=UPI001E2B142D|nr:carboxypeptidase-like regulatory domain-containing protein [Tenacibaculum finnmarkense]MCD8447895.1 carboxypeptidase-like regulatory domain-containing protein [Tenacibaculum finnmarkense genomovar finnmarkense]